MHDPPGAHSLMSRVHNYNMRKVIYIVATIVLGAAISVAAYVVLLPSEVAEPPQASLPEVIGSEAKIIEEPVPQAPEQLSEEDTEVVVVPEAPFETNDYLDIALEELDAVE